MLAIQWLIVASSLAVIGAWAATTIGTEAARDVADPDRAGVWLNFVGLGIALLLSVVTGIVLPGWRRRIVVVLIVGPALVLLLTSHNALAGLSVLVLLFPMVWLGRACVAALLGPVDALSAWVVGSAFGFGITAVLGFILGSVGILRPQVIWSALLIITLVLWRMAWRLLIADWGALRAWLCRPSPCDAVGLVLVGIATALFWYSLIGALSPETASDTVRHRLVTAGYFASTGRLATDDPELPLATTPAVGEIAFAVALTIGPLHTAKLMTFLQGLCCAAAIFAVGRRLGNDQAGGIAAFTFFSMPLVSWLSQTAYLDLLTTLLALAALLAIVLEKRPSWRAAVAAGVCIGLGVGVKLHFGYVAIGFAVILGLIALRNGRPQSAVRLVLLLIVAATLAAAPWLLRSTIATGQVPGLALATRSLTRVADERPAVLGDLPRFGYGRSLGRLLSAPFDMTLRSTQFEWTPTRYGPFGGLIGFLLLGLVPLLVCARLPRRWPVLAVLAGTITAFGLWFYTAQYLRYALPILAMVCPLGAVAYVAARDRIDRPVLRTLMSILLLVLVAAGVAVQVQVPAMGRHFVLGREDAAGYLTRNLICCNGYPVLHLLNAEPVATRALALEEPARLYTSVRVSGMRGTGAALSFAGDEDQLLERLRQGGYSHIIVDRETLPRNWESLTVLGEEFLRRNTALVGGGKNAYLYRILPPDQRGRAQPWAAGRELLVNGGFEDAQDGLPHGWAPVGRPLHDTSAQASRSGRGAVRSSADSGFLTSVEVVPHTQYLLSHSTRSGNDKGDRARLSLAWRNSAGESIGATREVVPVSAQAYHPFSMLATAPSGAVTATVHVQAEEGDVWFDDVSLRSVLPDHQVAPGSELWGNHGVHRALTGLLTVPPGWIRGGQRDAHRIARGRVDADSLPAVGTNGSDGGRG